MKIRPMLTDANRDTWPTDFQDLWDTSPWFLLGMATDLPSPPPSVIQVTHPEGAGGCQPRIPLNAYPFSYPGPCGLTTHLFYANKCPTCLCVFWLPGPVSTEPWTDTHFHQIRRAQETDHGNGPHPLPHGADERPSLGDDPPPGSAV